MSAEQFAVPEIRQHKQHVTDLHGIVVVQVFNALRMPSQLNPGSGEARTWVGGCCVVVAYGVVLTTFRFKLVANTIPIAVQVHSPAQL